MNQKHTPVLLCLPFATLVALGALAHPQQKKPPLATPKPPHTVPKPAPAGTEFARDVAPLIKKYCDSGKPILGIRTASHGFQNWLDMDKDVYGGNYKNHNPGGPKCEVSLVDKQKDDPILKGVKPYSSAASLYKNTDVAKDVTVLLTGTIPKEREPLAWTRERKVNEKSQRIFYTSLGHTDDFAEASFKRLLINAIGWCLSDDKTFAE